MCMVVQHNTKANKCGLPTLTSCDYWSHWHASVWTTSFHCLGMLSVFTCSLTFNIKFRPSLAQLSLFPLPHPSSCNCCHHIDIMPANQSSRSSTPSVHPGCARDSSDEPMFPRDRACCHSDKRRVARSPSPCHYCFPSHEGCHEKHHCVTAHNNFPPPAQWIATTTGLLVHDPRDQCPKCLAYQHHVSLDLVLEMSSIMNAHNDCLTNLACIMGWDDAATKLCNELASVCCDCNHWCRQAEEAERASAVSEQQATATFEQARLLSMYIPSADPKDTPGGGSGMMPTSVHSGEPCS